MRSTFLLSGLALLPFIFGSPLTSFGRGAIRDENSGNPACPDITVSDVTVTGDSCNYNSQVTIGYDQRSFEVQFGDFQVNTNSPAHLTSNCTLTATLEYPLPVPAGCPNIGNFYTFSNGNAALRDGDTALRIISLEFTGGPNAQYLADSTDPNFTRQEFETDGPFSDTFTDQAFSNFTFAAAPDGSGSSTGPIDIVTFAIYYELDLTATQPQDDSSGTATLAADVIEFEVQTYGTPNYNSKPVTPVQPVESSGVTVTPRTDTSSPTPAP